MSAPRIKRTPVGLYVTLALLVLVLLAYFVLSSAGFFRSVVLPKVGAALNSDVSVGDISFSPLSSLRLTQIKVTPKGRETLLAADSLTVRYSAFGFIGGKVKVSELTLENPVIHLHTRADGSSNLDPITSQPSSSSTRPASKSSAPPSIDLKNISLRNGTLRQTTEIKGQTTPATLEITGLQLALDQLSNPGNGKLTLGGNLSLAPSPADQLAAKLDGALEIALAADLTPSQVKGSIGAAVGRATGSFRDAQQIAGKIDLELSPTELRGAKIEFKRGAEALGSISVAGPVELSKKEVRLTYEIKGINRSVLNVAGGVLGFDFGDTAVNASGRLDLGQLGQAVTSSGKITADRFSLRSPQGATPPVDASVDYQTSVRLDDKTALVQKLELKARQGARDLVVAGLDRPMNLAWGKNTSGFRESVFNLKLTELDLGEWKAFLGANPPAGKLSANLSAQADRDGQTLKIRFDAAGQDLNLPVGTGRLDKTQLQLQGEASAIALNAFTLDKFSANVQRDGKPLATASGLANYRIDTTEGGIQITVNADLPGLTAAVPVPNLDAKLGKLSISSQYQQRGASTNVAASINLSDLNGSYGDFKFRDYQVTLQFTTEITSKVLNIGRANFTGQTGVAAGGSFDLDGKYDLERKTGQFNFKTVNLTESALGPFLAPSLQPNQLKSVALDISGQATLDASAESKVTATAKVTNLVVDDPSGLLPKSPFAASLSVDGGMKKEAIELRNVVLSLGPTPRAENHVYITGLVDLAKTNAAPSKLAIKSQALDLTTLYDLFFAGGSTNATAANKPSPTPAPAAPPAAATSATNAPGALVQSLPIQTLDAQLDLAKVFLRSIEIKNWKAQASLKSGVFQLSPFQLTLNDSPVSANAKVDLNPASPIYNLSFDANKVPIAPLNDSLFPKDAGRLAGYATAKTQLQGQGTSGAELERFLAGNFSLVATNLNLPVAQVKTSILRTIIDVVLGIPEMIRNPGGAVVSLLSKLSGAGNSPAAGSWTEDILRAPIQSISVNGKAANGFVTLENSAIQSPAFLAEPSGQIRLQPVLTNSTLEIPVQISLERNIASKAGLLPINTPTNAVWGKLPDFVALKGTLGNPKPAINYVNLSALTLRAGAGVVTGVGKAGLEKASGALETLGGFLNPRATPNATAPNTAAPNTAAPNAAKTNAPAATQPTPNNPINRLRGLLNNAIPQPNPNPNNPPPKN